VLDVTRDRAAGVSLDQLRRPDVEREDLYC
jgi:hypothetical protein